MSQGTLLSLPRQDSESSELNRITDYCNVGKLCTVNKGEKKRIIIIDLSVKLHDKSRR